MVSIVALERILDTYSFIEILDWNDLTEVEALQYLLDQGFLTLPTPVPADLNDG